LRIARESIECRSTRNLSCRLSAVSFQPEFPCILQKLIADG